MKRTVWILLGFILFALLSVTIYMYFYSKPSAFLNDDELLKKINSTHTTAKAVRIQDTISVDDFHYFVPFQSKTGGHGTSYWEWKKNKWQVLMIDTVGQPLLWKVEGKTPSTYRIVWNLHPDDKVNSSHYYLTRERGYFITGDQENYFPKVEMVKKITHGKQSYGVVKLSKEWVSVIDSLIKMESVKQTNFYDHFTLSRFMYLGWTPYDRSGNEVIIEHSVNGNGYHVDDIDLEFVRYMDGIELEQSGGK
ncbi:hypothetical protein KUV80_08020 [Fictibacillus nanhaiensis]|uniref:hypothetical protein n=1 Tax=Fictibacillus nanhaiensis TaxID=742169 RepID=UPI001C93A128|nr:hypothetical protein [Fictibacillus nanhaiensis]MBY6036595.1 hypothetical protein [Fictibacillus nanhaiensis]